MSVVADPGTLKVPSPSSSSRTGTRLLWIDQLRLGMILLVVNMHACVTYTHIGSWYYNSTEEPSKVTKLLFAMWQGHLQSFFMGLLFFLAGYFAESSKTSKGSTQFFKDRLWRLGLPTLLFMFLIHPATIYILKSAGEADGFTYLGYIRSGKFLSGTGPLWFAEALLIFCSVFAFLPRRTKSQITPKEITAGRIALAASLVALISFLVRIYQPIGTSVLNLQLCFFTQYVAAFAAGIWLRGQGSLSDLAQSRLAARAGWAALLLGPAVLIAVYVLGGSISDQGPNPYFGGLHLQSLATCFWEQFAGVGLGLGTIAISARKLNRPSKFGSWLSDRAFGVYVLHTPILVGLALWFRPLSLPTLALVLLLTGAGLLLTFLASDLARRIPGLNQILS